MPPAPSTLPHRDWEDNAETPRPLPWENALIAAPLAVRLHLAGGRVGSRPGEAAGPWQFLATWT